MTMKFKHQSDSINRVSLFTIACLIFASATMNAEPSRESADVIPAVPLFPASVTHRFACTDYSQGKVFIVDVQGKVEWEYPASSCNDLWVLPINNLGYWLLYLSAILTLRSMINYLMAALSTINE